MGMNGAISFEPHLVSLGFLQGCRLLANSRGQLGSLTEDSTVQHWDLCLSSMGHHIGHALALRRSGWELSRRKSVLASLSIGQRFMILEVRYIICTLLCVSRTAVTSGFTTENETRPGLPFETLSTVSSCSPFLFGISNTFRNMSFDFPSYRWIHYASTASIIVLAYESRNYSFPCSCLLPDHRAIRHLASIPCRLHCCNSCQDILRIRLQMKLSGCGFPIPDNNWSLVSLRRIHPMISYQSRGKLIACKEKHVTYLPKCSAMLFDF